MSELNRRDPQWAEKIRRRKEQDIEQMSVNKARIQNKIEEREKQIRADEAQNLKISQLKSQIEAEKERLADISRQGQLRELS